ncbi:NAD(P)H-binding protein [Azorhizobium doebereinerae]|uniref:NAD(P)H-binding protein n=1 Tax=Azorhizobium doebereinerae TaxID=281091 RepID=UPI0004084C30|nr:NAD(P)H-binding protein [Azorhizobium doebereinerae]
MVDGPRRVALVLGANGGVGGETAAALLRRGWTVKALVRDPAAAARRWAFEGPAPAWIAGDAMVREQVVAAAAGAGLVVHGVNPPGYRDWDRLVVPMMENTIAAARAAGARIVLPGTVYNFGPDAFADPHEDAPQHPATRKGALRVAMEERLRVAAEAGVPCLIVRCGDFFGPRAGNTWFAQGLVKPGRPVTAISAPGRRGVGHQWAYLPDVAEVIARLAELDGLPARAVFHMEGHWDPDGTAMVKAIRTAVGLPVQVRAFPWWLVTLASPLVSLFRELREMRYLWQVPLHMRNQRLVVTLGTEPHTPLDRAVRDTLVGIGCLPAGAAGKAGDPMGQAVPAAR